MARTQVAFLAVLIVGLLMVTNVSAATLQGLEWGIADGDQFNFDLTSTGDDVFSEIMYFECTSTPVIPNIADTWAELTVADFTVSWANGTTLGWSALIFIFYFVAINHFAVPTGNYTLLGELYGDSIYNGTLYDQSGFWGVDLALTWFTVDYDIHVDYLKDDGMLAHWSVETANGTLSLVRQNLPSALGGIMDFIQNNLLVVVVGVGVVVIVLAVVCRRK